MAAGATGGSADDNSRFQRPAESRRRFAIFSIYFANQQTNITTDMAAEMSSARPTKVKVAGPMADVDSQIIRSAYVRHSPNQSPTTDTGTDAQWNILLWNFFETFTKFNKKYFETPFWNVLLFFFIFVITYDFEYMKTYQSISS